MLGNRLSYDSNQLTRRILLVLVSIVIIIALVSGCVSKSNEISADVAKQAINQGLEECPQLKGCGTIWVKSCVEYRQNGR